MSNTRPTQCQRILDWFKHNPGKGLTQFEAISDLGILRLASRISELKKEHAIESKTVVKLNRFGEKCRVSEYRLVTKKRLAPMRDW